MPSIYNELHTPLDEYYISPSIDDYSLHPTPNRPTTYYVSALCGAGKTVALADVIAEETKNPFSRNFLYVCPTKILMTEFQKHLEDRQVARVKSFNGDLIAQTTVSSAVVSYCRAEVATNGGHVLLITHATFIALSRFFNRSEWDIYIDEAPQITDYEFVNITHSYVLLRDIIGAKPYNGKLIELFIKNKVEFDSRRRSEDSGLVAFTKLFKWLRADNYRVFTSIQAFDALQGPAPAQNSKRDARFPYVAEVQSEIFSGVTIMGANLEKHMVFDLLKRSGHTLRENQKICSRLIYRNYPPETVARLTTYYLIEGSYSKGKAAKPSNKGKVLIETMHEAALNAVDGQEFVFLTNKDTYGAMHYANNGQELPHKSSGLNSFQHHTIFVSLAAFKRDETNKSLHAALGYGKECLQHTTEDEELHQAIMRTNLRVRTSTKKVIAIFSDTYAAGRLTNLIGSAKPSLLGDIEIIKEISPLSSDNFKSSLTQTQKNQNRNAQKLKKRLWMNEENTVFSYREDVSLVPDDLMSKDTKSTIQTEHIEQSDYHIDAGKRQVCLLKAIRVADRSHPPDEFTLRLTLHKSIYDKSPESHRSAAFSISEFVDEFRTQKSHTIAKKEKLTLFNPSQFDTFSPYDEYRTKSNFVYASAVVLDFDKGTMTPEQFEDVFWHHATSIRKFSFLNCNTFSRSPEQPNRFRVVIPLATPIRSVQGYERVVDWIQYTLMEELPDDIVIGLDKKSRSAVQSYYLPCTNQKHPKSAFLRSYGLNKKEFKRWGLKTSGFEQSIPLTGERGTTETVHIVGAADRDRFESLRSEIEALMAMSEGRHERYFQLTWDLRNVSVSYDEARSILLHIAKGEEKMIRKAHCNLQTVKKKAGWN